jgi:SAM-dependent methyltransferase
MNSDAWRDANRANWDERVGVHLASASYDLGPLKAGRGCLNPIESDELGPVDGRRVLHLQCHFGRDSLTLAQQGAEVVGLDFSAPAIAAARKLAAELGLSDRAQFVEADLYDAPAAIPEPAAFDIVFVTWGALCWLPDIRRWAEIVVRFLKPGGFLYLAEGHPAALVFDDCVASSDGMPGRFVPYFERGSIVIDEAHDYAVERASLQASRTYQWLHPRSDVVTALLKAGLRLAWLHEHDRVPWRMFAMLVQAENGMYCWPDKPWLPLSFSLRADKPG